MPLKVSGQRRVGIRNISFLRFVAAQFFASPDVFHPVGIQQHRFGAQDDIGFLYSLVGTGAIKDLAADHDGKIGSLAD